MKAIWTVISVCLLINALALVGGVAWLIKTERLDQPRFDRIRELLTMTVPEEKEEQLKVQQLEEESRQKAEEIARLESVSDGPVTLADRLRTEQLRDELAMQRVERLRRDIADMRRQVNLAQSLLAEKQTELDNERKAFSEKVERQRKLQTDADFLLTVQMLQKIKPKQGKQIFQELLKKGQRSQVVDYLAAMQLRKSAGVIKTFKTPEEIVQAADLLQALRERGIELTNVDLAGSTTPAQRASPG